MAMIDISMISGIPEIGRLKIARLQTSELISTMITKIHAVPRALRAEISPSNTPMTRVRQCAAEDVDPSVASGI